MVYRPGTSSSLGGWDVNQILQGDVMRLEASDAREFNVLICDPPYSEHVHKSAVSQSARGGVRPRDLGFDCISVELRDHIAMLASNVSRWSLIYSDIEGLGEWREALTRAGATYIRAVPWIRWSMPQLSGDRPPSGCEMITIAWGRQTGKKSWNGPGNLTHFAHKCLRGGEKHKAAKPLDQLLDLVEFFTDPSDQVIVPCGGSGTAALACQLLGRSCVEIEIDPAWVSAAQVRVSETMLSPVDQERFDRYMAARTERIADMVRMAEITTRSRARLEADK
jgi:DNA methylase